MTPMVSTGSKFEPMATCGYGHELTEPNVYRYTDGAGRERTECRTCHVDRSTAYRRRQGIPTKARTPAEPHPRDDRSVVYFISDGVGHVKIGVAVDVQKRLTYLQTSNPFELVLLATLPGRHRLEHQLHLRFAAYRVRGEWFKLSPEIQEFISAETVTPG